MLPLWLVYLFIALILLADVLLVAGVIIVGAFLVAYIAFNVFTGFIKWLINQFIHDLLDYLKDYVDRKSQGKTSDYGKGFVDVVRFVYRAVFWAYNLFQLGIDVAISLAAVALIGLGMFALAIINLALAWLVYAYLL